MKLIIVILLLPILGWSQKKQISSGDAIPQSEINNIDCLDNSVTSVRLLGHEPHVPFAVIDGDTIKSAGQPCCEEWATTQTEWFNLDEKGRVVGTSKLERGDGYDVTQCYELQLKTFEGKDGIGLYASKKVSWELDSSQIWSPNAEEKEKLDSFILRLDDILIDNSKPNYVDTLTQGKTLFFKIASGQNEDKAGTQTTKCVVFGKRYLMLAYLNKHGNWILAHVENQYTNEHYKLYTPIAIMDIDKDGIPEIIYQDSLGHAFWDKILRIQDRETIDSWKIEAVSVEGATI